jgi:hypothetical protein
MSINIIKKQLTDFIVNSIVASKDGINNKNNYSALKNIYELQKHFNYELKRYNLKLVLDTNVNSKAIIKSFDSINVKAHTTDYYCFPFLIYICKNYTPKLSVSEYINGFVEKEKKQLSWKDLVICTTGGTRCKNNLRFALVKLRKLQLIKSKNNKGKRSYFPTLLGQLLVLYFNWLDIVKGVGQLKNNEISYVAYVNFAQKISSLRESQNLQSFLSHLSKTHLKDQESKRKIIYYLKLFNEIMFKYMTITESGVKFKSEMNQSPEYQKLLSMLNTEEIDLFRDEYHF